MYCSTCGSAVPAGISTCGACGGAELGLAAKSGATSALALPAAAGAIGVCPRCQYQGEGLGYFTRGAHMAALMGATLFTLPYALGAGGFLYYGMRHDHRICPRCGQGWGRRGQHAVDRGDAAVPVATRGLPRVHFPRRETPLRAWSIGLFLLAPIFLAAGVAQLEIVLIVMGVLAAGGALLLHRSANHLREQRRSALLASLQLPVLRMAAERGGRLTVTEVAAALGWPLRRAEKVLNSLEDGWRVDSEVTDDGVIVYEFRELILGHGASRPGSD